MWKQQIEEPLPMIRIPNRASLLALFLLVALGCESSDRLTSPTTDDGLAAAKGPTGSQGIPFGMFAQPISLYGPTYSGGHLNPVRPESLLTRLAAIKAAKGRVVLALAGGPAGYTKPDGTFDFELWKSRVSRYTVVDFSSYISDSTILGNYVIDEPNCASCWGGQPIPQGMVEAMAQYSKSLWPNMKTMARVDPTWLAAFSGEYVYLDAGWAQYVMRKGDVNTFLSQNVAAAQSKGLGLVVGLNLLGGGLNNARLNSNQLKDFGSILLGSSKACAFISWQYNADYLALPDIQSAMALLSKKAARHVQTPCT
jgi:hypothetical protein